MNLDDIKLSSPYNDKKLFEPCKCDICKDYSETDDMRYLGENNDNYDEDSFVCEYCYNRFSINFKQN